MGIGSAELQFLLNEHKYRPITGEVLAIGRQNTAFDEAAARKFLDLHKVPARTSALIELDTDTAHGNKGQHLSDRSLLSLFSDCSYRTADISAYEGADFIFDICGEVPEELRNRFDFVLDGGSLDNVFDPFRMLRNMAAMLKPGGRVFLTPWINSFPSAYVKLSPDWVMDYFAVNEWADAKVYVFTGRLNDRPASMWQYEPAVRKGVYQTAGVEAVNLTQLLAVAEIGPGSTVDRAAIQKHYRAQAEPYVSAAARFSDSRRPIYSFPTMTGAAADPISKTGAMRHIGTQPY